MIGHEGLYLDYISWHTFQNTNIHLKGSIDLIYYPKDKHGCIKYIKRPVMQAPKQNKCKKSKKMGPSKEPVRNPANERMGPNHQGNHGQEQAGASHIANIGCQSQQDVAVLSVVIVLKLIGAVIKCFNKGQSTEPRMP